MNPRKLMSLLAAAILTAGLAPACGDSGGTAGDDTGSSTGDETGATGDETGATGDETGATGDETGATGDAGIDWASAPALPEHEAPEIVITENDPVACPGGLKMETITGSIIDSAGAPLVNSKAQACIRKAADGQLGCLQPTPPDDQGVFTIGVPNDDHACASGVSMRVLVPGQQFSTNYCNVDLVSDDTTLSIDWPFQLHETVPAADVPEVDEGDPDDDTDDMVTVTFADGMEIDVFTWYDFAGYASFGAAWVEPDNIQCLPDYLSDIEGAYAFSPEGDIWNGGDDDPFPGTFDARIPAGELADGTWVALYVLGGINCTNPAGDHYHEGVWEPFAVAPVVDGMIHAIGDAGMPCFSWLTWLPVE